MISAPEADPGTPHLKYIHPFRVYLNQPLGEGAEGLVVKSEKLNSGLVVCKINQHLTCESSKNAPASPFIVRERRNLKSFGQLEGELTEVKDDIVTNYTFMPYHQGIPLLDHLYDSEMKAIPKPHKVYTLKRQHSLAHIIQLAVLIGEIMLDAHQKGFVIRDLKSDNFIVHNPQSLDEMTLTMIDYGSLLTLQEARVERSLDGTTNGYRAQELDVDKKEDLPPFTKQQDYFSFGVVLGELLTTSNFQQALLETTQSNPASFMTVEKIKLMMPDVFQADDLMSFRKTSSRKNLLDKKNRARFYLNDLIYKLLAPIQENHSHSTSSNFIEFRPTEDELKIHIGALKDLRHKLLKAEHLPHDQSASSVSTSADLMGSLSEFLAEVKIQDSSPLVDKKEPKLAQKACLNNFEHQIEVAKDERDGIENTTTRKGSVVSIIPAK